MTKRGTVLIESNTLAAKFISTVLISGGTDGLHKIKGLENYSGLATYFEDICILGKQLNKAAQRKRNTSGIKTRIERSLVFNGAYYIAHLYLFAALENTVISNKERKQWLTTQKNDYILAMLKAFITAITGKERQGGPLTTKQTQQRIQSYKNNDNADSVDESYFYKLLRRQKTIEDEQAKFLKSEFPPLLLETYKSIVRKKG